MAQQLTALAILAEDAALLPTFTLDNSKPPVILSQGNLVTSSGFPSHLHAWLKYIYAYTQEKQHL